MNSGNVGIIFKELMSGGFALGETDPETGADKGKSNGLSMHGTVTIDDIDSFVNDSNHKGVLDVIMDWAPFGMGIAAPGGVFNLFSPSGDPTLKLMVYEWPVMHAGRQYYFAGQKNVREHPIFDLWKDTTTLYTKLYEGTDKTGPVVGAGIISLSFAELAQMTTNFKALNAPTHQAGLAGRF